MIESTNTEVINVVYHSDVYKDKEFKSEEWGNWIDVRSADNYAYEKGDFFLVDLGFSMELPSHLEGRLAPRSSTFKKYGVIQTNSIGVVDASYSGNDDIWKMPVFALCDGVITKGERVAQFKIEDRMKPVHFNTVDRLTGENRGGFGSTGSK